MFIGEEFIFKILVIKTLSLYISNKLLFFIYSLNAIIILSFSMVDLSRCDRGVLKSL